MKKRMAAKAMNVNKGYRLRMRHLGAFTARARGIRDSGGIIAGRRVDSRQLKVEREGETEESEKDNTEARRAQRYAESLDHESNTAIEGHEGQKEELTTEGAENTEWRSGGFAIDGGKTRRPGGASPAPTTESDRAASVEFRFFELR